jgi:peptidyl-prolyl cis-trans isomerase B (cyclophilin B)
MKKELVNRIITIIAIILVLIMIGYVCYGFYQKATVNIPNPVATIEVENYGTIKVELYPDQAPNTVANFIKLANNGFYDGLTFHRTIPDFMIQGGDKDGDGTGSPSLSDLDESLADESYAIKGEFIANKYNNTLKLERGVIAMARSDYSSISSSLAEEGYNSAGSQFFIMQGTQSSLDGLYAGFGKVIEGLDIVDQIANVEVYYRDSELADDEEAPTDEDGNEINSDTPIEKPVITSIRVETYGVDYGMPETEEPFNYYNWLIQNYYSSSSY